MALCHFSSRRSRLIALIIAGAGLAHFALSILLWGFVAAMGYFARSDWTRIWSAIVLLAAFIMALLFAWRGLRISRVLMLAAFILAAVCFSYDLGHQRYQFRWWLAEGDYMYDYTYLTWWWYEERHTAWSDREQPSYQIRTWSILGLFEHSYRHYQERSSRAK
jgi:hypothetical protein